MNRATPALLALVLVLSLPAMAVGGATPTLETESEWDEPDPHANLLQTTQETQSTPVETENTTNRLPLPADSQGGYVEYDANLGTSLASADDELRIDHEQYVITEAEFDDATADERTEMIDAAYERIQERIDALEDREQDAIQAHANGDRSEAEVLGTIVRNYHEATILHDAIDTLDRNPDSALSSDQLRADRTILDFHQTPIRADLAATEHDSDTESYSFLFESSQAGYRLSTRDGSDYVTETIRFDNRDVTQSDQFVGFESIEHANELYPWTSESFGGDYPTSEDHSTERNFYWIEYPHEQGTLEIYLDGGTGDVHREVQELSIEALPRPEEETWSEDGLDVSLNQTPANGPAELTVTESTFSEPEQATVSIDGVVVGETDAADGTLWILPPANEYELTVEGTTGTLNETVSSDESTA